MKTSTLTSRREFLATACGGCALLVGCGAKKEESPSTGPVTLSIASDAPTLSEVGGFAKQTFGSNNGGKPVLIVRTGQNEVKVMSTVCTHQGATIGDPSGGQSVCPLHGAIYSIQGANFGQNIGGQLSATLSLFSATLSGDTITINF